MTGRYRLIIVPEVSDEIADLHSFYEEVSEGLGDEFMDNLGDCLRQLLINPNLWQYAQTKKERIRRALLKKPSVVVLYLVQEDEVRILAVRDARSDWFQT